MTEITKITCDCCDKDITETGRTPAFRIVVSCESLPHNTDTIYAVIVNPPLDKRYHFCNLICMRKFAF